MLQLLKLTSFTILFNLFQMILGDEIKYNPEIYNIQLPSGVKYYIKKDANPCPRKAEIQEFVSFHFNVSLIEGENVKYFSSSRTKLAPVSITLGITGALPTGKSGASLEGVRLGCPVFHF